MMTFLLSFLISAGPTQSAPFEVQKVYKVSPTPPQRFDLSGILKITPALKKRFGLKGDFLLINDKSSAIFEGTIEGNTIRAREWIDLSKYNPMPDFDLEDIDFDGKQIFVVHEANGTVFDLTPGRDSIKVKWQSWENPYSDYPLSAAFGIEALAASGGRLFLGKEMSPLGIFEFKSAKPLNQQKPRLSKRSAIGSQTALRVRGDTFYLLDREGRCVWRTKEFDKNEKCLSIEAVLRRPDTDYVVKDKAGVEHPEWGTAEGLDIDGDTFYIGLDNNALPLRKDPSETRSSLIVLKYLH